MVVISALLLSISLIFINNFLFAEAGTRAADTSESPTDMRLASTVGPPILPPLLLAAGSALRPLSDIAANTLQHLRFILCDIDDTVTTEGKLTARAYAAMERLSDSGLSVIPITGRPGGWCDHIARMWP